VKERTPPLSLSLSLSNLWSPGNTIGKRGAKVPNGQGNLSLSILLALQAEAAKGGFREKKKRKVIWM
jgi:hypothetical protein